MCNQKQVKVFPQPVKRKPTKNTPAYYNCLFKESLNGFQQPITKVCRNCKMNATNLANERNSEIHTLMNAYQQMGDCLRNLLTPLPNE